MSDDITFTDLAAIIKIKPDTTVEKYGGLINSSLFDAANVLGTLSQKKLISFTTAMPGQNPIVLTEAGKNLMAEADSRAAGEFDHLDLTILQQMQKGMNAPADIAKAINISPRDLAMHLYKMMKQGYSAYEFRSGIVTVMLTEKGFSQAKAGMPQPSQQGVPVSGQATQATQQQTAAPTQANPQTMAFKPAPQPQAQSAPSVPPQVPATGPGASPAPPAPAAEPPKEMTPEQVEGMIKEKAKKTLMLRIAVLAVIIIIGVVILYLEGKL